MPVPLFEQQLLAAAGQFDGTAGRGLVTIADFIPAIPPDTSQAIVIKSVSYDAAGAPHDALLVLARAGQGLVAGGFRQVLIATPFFGGITPVLTKFACQKGQNGIVVPREAASYQIEFHTNGKAGDGTFIVHGYLESVTNA